MTSSAVNTLNAAKLQMANVAAPADRSTSVQSFDDVMKNTGKPVETQDTKKYDSKPAKADSETNVQESKDAEKPVTEVNDSKSTEATGKTEQTNETVNEGQLNKAEQPTKEELEAMSELMTSILAATEQIINAVAEITNSTPEAVTAAMQDLNMTDVSLLTPENVKALVLDIAGDTDGTMLLTDETMYSNVQDLMQLVADLGTEVAENTTLTPDSVSAVLQFMETAEQTVVTANGEEAIAQFTELMQSMQPQKASEIHSEDAPKVQVTFEREVSVRETAVSESSIGTEEVAETETETLSAILGRSEAQEMTDNGNSLSGYLQTFLQNLTQTQEVFTEAVQTTSIPDTEQFLQEVMDYMRVHVGSETSEIEMQLHPESLGTLNIHLSSHEGNVTAQFITQNEDVRATLQSQLLELRAVLENQGVKIDAVEVTVSDFGDHMSQDNSQTGQNGSESEPQKKNIRRIDLNLLTEDADDLSEEEQLTAEMMKANGNTVDYTA